MCVNLSSVELWMGAKMHTTWWIPPEAMMLWQKEGFIYVYIKCILRISFIYWQFHIWIQCILIIYIHHLPCPTTIKNPWWYHSSKIIPHLFIYLYVYESVYVYSTCIHVGTQTLEKGIPQTWDFWAFNVNDRTQT